MLMPYGRTCATRQAGEPLRDFRLGSVVGSVAINGGRYDDGKLSHPKLRPLRVDFSHLPALPPADELYLALGTTISRPRSTRCSVP